MKRKDKKRKKTLEWKRQDEENTVLHSENK